ncbi:T9SS type A sorting domain-containing protein [Marinoscillum sp.]|uniref:T9SS type A sorting domain-containing protein n=1 Tax=Marinoscillum sp. TaxID=2024838 RepID=UPI003BAB81EB
MNRFNRLILRHLFISCLLGWQGLHGQGTTVTTISADGPGGTYALLENALGGSPLEVPDCDHEETFQHIEEVYDEVLDRYVFNFYIHKDIDTDRCETNVDRQRNEIKAYDPSPDYLKAIQREIVTYEWYFRIDEGFQPSSNFTHLFQLKVVGGNDSANPLLTITPRKGDPDKLQLIHGRGNNNYTALKDADLSLIKGQWAKAFCKAEFAEDTGKLDFRLELLDGTEVLTYTSESIDMWRVGASFVRPKWGIYRSLNDIASLRDEEVFFADFQVTEIGACPIWYEDADGDGLGDPNSFVYECERPEGYVQNNVDTCLDWYEDKDEDGLGNPDVKLYACEQPAGYVDNSEDDNDLVSNILAISEKVQLAIYPNPVLSILKIRGLKGQSYSVHNLSGQQVMVSNEAEVSVAQLRAGIYFVKTRSGEILRFVKK